MRTIAILALGLSSAVGFSRPAIAQQSWNGTISTDWFVPGNWTPSTVPTSNFQTKIETVSPRATVIGGGAAETLVLSLGTVGTGSLTIQNGGTLNVAGLVEMGISPSISPISGTGSLVVTGAGSSVNVGTVMMIFGPGTSVAVRDGATLIVSSAVVDNGFHSTSFGPLFETSNGGLTIETGGSLTTLGALFRFGGTNSTLIVQSGGNLSAGDAVIFGSNTSFLVSGPGSSVAVGKLDLGNGSAGTVSLVVENGGAVNVAQSIQMGPPGTLTVTGPSSSLTTRVVNWSSGGILNVQNGGTATVTGGIVGHGTINVTGLNSSLTVGATFGQFPGSLSVLDQARATFNELNIGNGGNLNVGVTGRVTVNNTLQFVGGSTYSVGVSPTAAGRVDVAGSATLGGTLNAIDTGGNYAGFRNLVLMTAGSIVGRFASFTTTGAFTGASTPPTLKYDAHNVYLVFNPFLTPFLGSTAPSNARNVAAGIDAAIAGGTTPPSTFDPLFALTGNTLANALSQLSGEAATGAQQGAFQLTNQFLGLMLDPFAGGGFGAVFGDNATSFAPERALLPDDIAHAYAAVLKAPVYKAPTFEQRWTMWGSAYGGYNRTKGDPVVVGSNDLAVRAGGFAAGMDYRLARDTVVGFALAGAGTGWGLAAGLGGGRSDAFQAGVYGVTRSGPLQFAVSAAFTNYWMSTDRVAFAGNRLTANFNAQSVGARAEAGYRVGTQVGAFTPYAALQAQNFRTPSYSEVDLNNGGFGLAFNARNATATRSELGARFDRAVMLDQSKTLALRAKLAWAHDWVSDPTLNPVFQALPGSGFIVNGAAPAKDLALASAAAELRMANGVTLIGKFDGEFASRSQTYAGTGALRVNW